MISLLLSLALGMLVLACLVLKMKGIHLSRSWDIAICIVIPIVCLLTFLAIVVETSIRRNTNARELEKLLSVVELSLNSDRVFTSNCEKKQCLDSLRQYSERVISIAYDDSLISIVTGQDTCMQRRIVRTGNAVSQSIKWISRLNNICDENIEFTQKEVDDLNIKLIGPGSNKTKVINIAFQIINPQEHAICAYVQVVTPEGKQYSQAFELNSNTNCFNIPTAGENDKIELGYICQFNNLKIFKYITYAK